MKISLLVAFESHDLFPSLETQRNSVDRSIQAVISVIRYEFEILHVDENVWIPGQISLTGPRTTMNCPLTHSLLYTVSSGKTVIHLAENQ